MATASTDKLAELYLQDETAWLEANSESIRAGRLDQVDYPNLAEYLADMAKRDRREVTNRLGVLIAHLLKYQYQPERRSMSWRKTILNQRLQLEDLIESGVLRVHSIEVLPKAYVRGVKQAVVDTGLPKSSFPAECPFTMEEVLDGPMGEEVS